jgi:hypothetical protein
LTVDFQGPEINRQQAQGKEVAFRCDAAFAKPEIYEALEKWEVKHAIRLSANDHLQRNIRGVDDAASGTAKPEAGVSIHKFSLSGGDSPASGGEGRVPLRGVASPRGFIVTNLRTSSRALAGGETGPFRRRWEDRGPKRAETLAERGRPAYTGVGIGKSKRKSRVTFLTDQGLPRDSGKPCLTVVCTSCRNPVGI